MNSNIEIPVIDLFAGPGGLAEGFSTVEVNGARVFDIGLSIEKEENAQKTLELRSFCRQFPLNDLPKEYYSAVCKKEITEREQAIKILFKKYPKQYQKAKAEAIQHELGVDDNKLLDEKICDVIGDSKKWVLIGGPPCQAYSLAGRSRVGGIDSEDHRVYLYKEYLRVIAKFEPAVFVMENVKGLLSAKINGSLMFDMILQDLSNPSTVFPEFESSGYTIHSLVTDNVKVSNDFLIKTEDYGVPQRRHRVILIGIRNDIAIKPNCLIKSENKTPIEEAIDDLPKIRSGLNRKFIKYNSGSSIKDKHRRRIYKNIEDTDPNWETSINNYFKEISNLNGFKDVKNSHLVSPIYGIGSEYIAEKPPYRYNNHLKEWYVDEKLRGVLNHQSRKHLLQDLKRYLFATIYTEYHNNFPRLHDYEIYGNKLLPDHLSAKSGKFTDRFRVQQKGIPATTITSHISKDGHYFIHYNKEQVRSLSVREAARIQTFPDNYLFRGSRTQQFHQVGNAVPPFLAFQIGKIVLDVIKESNV